MRALRVALVVLISSALACRAIVGFDDFTSAHPPADASDEPVPSLTDGSSDSATDAASIVDASPPENLSDVVTFITSDAFAPPDGCVLLHVEVSGAGGGQPLNAGAGGAGGLATAAWVLEDAAVHVIVGSTGTEFIGGSPGGGAAGATEAGTPGYGGGGYSQVDNGRYLVIAGGGGGAGGCASTGGVGGGESGREGTTSPNPFVAGGGGTQTIGGASGAGAISGAQGAARQGGHGGYGDSLGASGGGGGGGWFGGGGGAGTLNGVDSGCGSGGGGSGVLAFLDAAAPQSFVIGSQLVAGGGAAPGTSGSVKIWCTLK